MGKVYLLVDFNQGYNCQDLEIDSMLVGAYNSYEKAFETFLDIKIQEIVNSTLEEERERDPYLDKELLAVDQMHYEDVINADQILTDWGWKIVEMKVERA